MKKDFPLLLLRLTFGGLMFWNHGLGKIAKIDNAIILFPDPLGVGAEFSLYLAIFAEVICAVFIVLGLLTRWAAIPLVFAMGVAAFSVHLNDSLANKEHSLLFLTAFLAILILGAGKFSLDQLLRPRAKF